MQNYVHDNIDYSRSETEINVDLLVPISNVGMKLSASGSKLEFELVNLPEDVEIKIVKSASNPKKFEAILLKANSKIEAEILLPRSSKIEAQILLPQANKIEAQILLPKITKMNGMNVVETKLLYSAKADQQYGFTDEYFSKGKWLLKIRQTIIALFSWICVIVPSYITIATFTSHLTKGKYGHAFWKYSEGIDEIWFLIYLLLFAATVTFIYATSMTIIQNFRREGTIEKWPTFDSIDDINKKQLSDGFMNKRFGSRALRHNIRYFDVQPEQNLEDNELPNYLHVDRG
ncbi:hypothetical protein WKK_01910 [Weissella koreensis KACC 15510]|uniref:hypothetical protein n=1 Tax=Weissella koreensis TaxID=165096 RepID=UPI0002174B02|nr:hypothetical protein [Weissella koreensis]AEJ23256.1 hypothetical protein WKK_01910 [Weissella koreensis KACC 15510]